jgi:cation diffusion facilitator CzcD-associated flavoprotein CzcO
MINTTPDIPSHAYQFTFASNPQWSRFYAKGGEIHSYLKDVAWKYDVEKYVRFRHLFQKADWDEQNQKWHVTVKNLETGEVSGGFISIHVFGNHAYSRSRSKQTLQISY